MEITRCFKQNILCTKVEMVKRIIDERMDATYTACEVFQYFTFYNYNNYIIPLMPLNAFKCIVYTNSSYG